MGPISQLCDDMHRSQIHLQQLNSFARADRKKPSIDGMTASRIVFRRDVIERRVAKHSRELIHFQPANDCDFRVAGVIDQI
jgi:hypothetical protein